LLPPVGFFWRITKADGNEIALPRLQQRALTIAANQLPAGQSVTATFLVYLQPDSSTLFSASATIDIKASALVAQITGGSARLVGVSQSVRLNGSLSFDPDAPTSVGGANGGSGSLVYLWSCTLVGGGSCFTGQPPFVLPSTAVVDIPPNTLAASTAHAFTLAVTSGSRSADASVTITTQAETPPSVSVRRAAGGAGVVSATRALRLLGDTSGLSVAWTVTSGANCSSADASGCPPGSPPTLPSSISLVHLNLIVPATPPVLLTGATYTFTLAAFSASGVRGNAALDLTVNRPPFGGRDAFTVRFSGRGCARSSCCQRQAAALTRCSCVRAI
jgi:hypothetical protein